MKSRISTAGICASSGIAPGPLFGRILRAVLVGKLDGETPDADSQRRLALDMARQEGVFPK